MFQPRKVERAGICDVAGRDVLEDVEWRYPADRYVLVDDNKHILAAVRQFWRERVATVFVRQGRYAHVDEPRSFPPADVTVERIGDLLDYDLSRL